MFKKLFWAEHLESHRGSGTPTIFPTDLSDQAWAVSQPLGPRARPGGRPEKDPKRDMLTGLFDLVRGGWAWRLRPHRPLRLAMTTRSAAVPGCAVIPTRGLVERPLA